MTMTTSPTKRRGQAAVETALALTVFAFIVAALVGFSEAFRVGFTQLVQTRAEAGRDALRANSGEFLGGSAAGIQTAATPKDSDWRQGADTGAFTSPWQYPRQICGDSAALRAGQGNDNPLVVRRSLRTENVPIDLSVLGSDALFPNGVTLSETVLMPIMEGLP